MGYGRFTKIEKLGENKYKIYAVTYTYELCAAYAWVWLKSRGQYAIVFMYGDSHEDYLSRYAVIVGEDYDVIEHPIKGYASSIVGNGPTNASDTSYPFDNDIVYTEPVAEEDVKEEETKEETKEESADEVVTQTQAQDSPYKGGLWEFPFEGASTGTDVLLQTRPMKLESDDLKGTFRVVLRGLFVGTSGKSSGLYVSGSIDGKRWMYLGGTERKHTGVPIRDIGTTIERNSCRFLMVVFVGNLLPSSRIEYFDITTADRYTEKPR